MFVRIQGVEAVDGFVVCVAFTDGTAGDIDLAPYLHGPIFQSSGQQPRLFRAGRVEYGALT